MIWVDSVVIVAGTSCGVLEGEGAWTMVV